MVDWRNDEDGWQRAEWDQGDCRVEVASHGRFWTLSVRGPFHGPQMRCQRVTTNGDIALDEGRLVQLAHTLIATLAVVEATATAPEDRECHTCGAVIGESGVIDGDSVSCSSCYLDAHPDPREDDGNGADLQQASVSVSAFDGTLADGATESFGRGE